MSARGPPQRERRLPYMNINHLAALLGDACYGFLAINFLWGLYNIVMGFRRQREFSFASHDEQDEFMDAVLDPLRAGNFAAVEELCADDVRRCRSSFSSLSPIAVWVTTSCGRS